jgi:hypothetical protein
MSINPLVSMVKTASQDSQLTIRLFARTLVEKPSFYGTAASSLILIDMPTRKMRHNGKQVDKEGDVLQRLREKKATKINPCMNEQRIVHQYRCKLS